MAEDRRHALLVEELKEAVGEEAVEQTDLDIDRALEPRRSRIGTAFSSARLLLLVAGAALLVVGVIASLALENWILLGLAIAAHALFATVVIASALALSTEVEKPAPTVEAALEEEGVADPSGVFNDLVEQVASEEPGSRTARLVHEEADETGPPEHDLAGSAARQQASATPASEPTRQAGEGS